MTPATDHVTIYATSWCPYCTSLRRSLDRAEAPYALIDVDADAEAASWVESVNDGNRVVPTVRYSDGTHATNPPARAVLRKLEELTES